MIILAGLFTLQRNLMKVLLVPVLATSTFLVGCSIDQNRALPPSTLYTWPTGQDSSPVKLHINLGQQRLYVLQSGKRIASTYITSGREGHDTPAGSYRVQEKRLDKKSDSYGWIENPAGERINHDANVGDLVPTGCKYVPSPLPYWLRLTGTGIGLHAGYIPRPGSTASHGCIRMPEEFAAKLYEAVKVGTPVTIERGHYDPWIAHPDPLPRENQKPRTRNGLRVVSPDDPWIIWPEGHPRAGR